MPTETITEAISILLVEDSPTESMLIQAALEDDEDTSFDIHHVDSLAGTKQALNLQLYDVVILDLTLPDSAGMDTFEQIHDDFPTVPVVILTANSSRDLAVKTVQMGAQDYILKEQIENMQLGMSLRYAIERKKAAEAVKQAHDNLESAYQELQLTQTQLVQNEKLASIGQLAAGVAHEMNTPLGFIASNLQSLQGYMIKLQAVQSQVDHLLEAITGCTDEALKKKGEEVVAFRKKMHIDFVLEDAETLFTESQEGIGTLASIVQSLRDFTRIDQAEEWSDYDFEKGIDSTLVMLNSELKEIEVGIEKGKIPAVPCNATQVNEALLNILRNALEALHAQEDNATPRISIRTDVSEEGLAICDIKDNGPGIAEEVLPKVFDPFFTTKPVGAGKGLGLSIAYDIVTKKHRGQLVVESPDGQGTHVRIMLPLAASSPSETATIVEEEE